MARVIQKIYRLCYVRDNILYFTDDFDNCWGDDWNDRPYEYNAEPPYEWIDEWTPEQNREHGHTHIKCIAKLWSEYYIKEPKDGYTNSPYSVEDINKGAIAWLWCEEVGALPAGATIEEAIEWLKKAGCKWGELHD